MPVRMLVPGTEMEKCKGSNLRTSVMDLVSDMLETS